MKNTEIIDESDLPILDDGGPPQALAVQVGGDMEAQTLMLEKAVKFAPRYMAALNTMLCSATFAEDWTQFGDGEKAKMCLGADGAMRIVSRCNFPINFHGVTFTKEVVTYNDYEGYRYLFNGYATLNNRTVHAIGQFSTRDAFLGKRSGEWKTEEEINESYIRKGAHSYFKSAAIKDLLGIRNIPLDEFEKMSIAAKRDPAKANTVKHNTGGQGGVTEDARNFHEELSSLLETLAGVCTVVLFDEEKKDNVLGDPPQDVVDYINDKQADPTETYKGYSLKALTTWVNKQGKLIKGHNNLQKIKAPQAKVLISKVKKMAKDEGLDV